MPAYPLMSCSKRSHHKVSAWAQTSWGRPTELQVKPGFTVVAHRNFEHDADVQPQTEGAAQGHVTPATARLPVQALLLRSSLRDGRTEADVIAPDRSIWRRGFVRPWLIIVSGKDSDELSVPLRARRPATQKWTAPVNTKCCPPRDGRKSLARNTRHIGSKSEGQSTTASRPPSQFNLRNETLSRPLC